MYSVKSNKLVIAFFIVFSSFNLIAAEHTVDDFTIHYNLLNSSIIEPKIATQYGIKRSKNVALLNISVIQKSDKPEGTAVIANIFGHGTSLAGQVKELAFKEVKEGSAIYYLATLPIHNGERLTFDLQIQPSKQGKLIPLKFKQKVYID